MGDGTVSTMEVMDMGEEEEIEASELSESLLDEKPTSDADEPPENSAKSVQFHVDGSGSSSSDAYSSPSKAQISSSSPEKG